MYTDALQYLLTNKNDYIGFKMITYELLRETDRSTVHDTDVFNPLTPKISLVILLTVCHMVLVMLVWRIGYWIN